jgi:hypothetical protein
MATAQRATARRDTTTTTMATGDDDNDVDGDSAMGNKRGGGLRQQRGKGLCHCRRRCRRRCRHCCYYRCRHRMPPRQLRHYCLCSSSGSRMPLLTPDFFCVFLVNVCYTWHRIPCQESFPPEFQLEFRIPSDSGTN